MTSRILYAAIGCIVLAACVSSDDRQWRDLQTILELREQRK